MAGIGIPVHCWMPLLAGEERTTPLVKIEESIPFYLIIEVF